MNRRYQDGRATSFHDMPAALRPHLHFFAKSKHASAYWRQWAIKYEKLSPRRKLPTEYVPIALCGRV